MIVILLSLIYPLGYSASHRTSGFNSLCGRLGEILPILLLVAWEIILMFGEAHIILPIRGVASSCVLQSDTCSFFQFDDHALAVSVDVHINFFR